MKLKLLIAALAVLMISGCKNGSSTIDDESASTPPPVSETPEPEKPKPVVAGWYLRTTAKATASNGKIYLHKSAGVMGELKESQDGKDRHDISAFGAPALSVVFIQKEWGEDNGDYFSDYRAYTGNEERHVWTIQVKNNTNEADLRNAVLDLMMENPYDVYEEQKDGRKVYKEVLSKDKSKKEKMILVDVDNQKEYTMEELQNVQLSMDGVAVRTFRWVLGSTTEEEYKSLAVSPANAKQIKSATVKTVKDPNDKFGLPPQV